MQTSPVLNQANALTTPTPAARQGDAGAAVTPFNQMLSREIADRHAADAPKPAQTNDAAAAADKPPAQATAKAESKKPTHDKSDDGTDGASDKDKAADGTGVTVQTPADMLALMGSLNPANATARDAKAGAEDDPALAALTGKKARDAGLQADLAGKKKPDADFSADDKAGSADLGTGGKQVTDLASKEHSATALASAAAKSDFAADMKDSMANATSGMQPLQQAALHAAQSANGAPADRLTPPVGTPAWDQALGQKVMWMVTGEHQSASLTLNPPDLGPLQVVLNVSHSTATATFTAAQPEVRQALEAALPKLRDMLGDAGIQLGQASVNSGNPNQQGAADQQAARGSHRIDHGDSRNEAPLRVGRVQPSTSGLGLVDTFV